MYIKTLDPQTLLTVAREAFVGSLHLSTSPFNRDLYVATTTCGNYTSFEHPAASSDANVAQFQALMNAVALRYASYRPSRPIRSRATDLTYPKIDFDHYAPLSNERISERYLKPFSPRRRINWCLGVSFDGRPVYIPEDLVYQGNPKDALYIANESGLAAHLDPLKAVEAAMLSRIKADACMRTWYKKHALYAFTPESMTAYVKERIAFWKTAGRDLIVGQLDNDYGEVYLAVIRGENFPAFACGVGITISGDTSHAINDAIANAEANFGLLSGFDISSSNMHMVELRTALDNALYYANPKNGADLDFLFEREELTKPYPREPIDPIELIKELRLSVCWLTSAGSSYQVVRVFSPKLVPITYGYALDHANHHALHLHGIKVDEYQSRTPHCFYRP